MPSQKAMEVIDQALGAYAHGRSDASQKHNRENAEQIYKIYDTIARDLDDWAARERGQDVLKWTKRDMRFAKTKEQLYAALAMVAHRQGSSGDFFLEWIARGEEVIEAYDRKYADVPQGVQPWRVGRDLEYLPEIMTTEQYVDAIAEAMRGHMQSQARKLGVWMDLRVYVRTITPEEERRKAQRERDYAARKFAADEKRKAAAEAKKYAKAIDRAKALAAMTTTEARAASLDLGGRRKAALGPGYKKAEIERAAQRGRDLELGPPTHAIEHRAPEPFLGIDTGSSSATPETDIQQAFFGLRKVLRDIYNFSGNQLDQNTLAGMDWARAAWEERKELSAVDRVMKLYGLIEQAKTGLRRGDHEPRYEQALELIRGLEHMMRVSAKIPAPDSYERGIVQRASMIEVNPQKYEFNNPARCIRRH